MSSRRKSHSKKVGSLILCIIVVRMSRLCNMYMFVDFCSLRQLKHVTPNEMYGEVDNEPKYDDVDDMVAEPQYDDVYNMPAPRVNAGANGVNSQATMDSRVDGEEATYCNVD